MKLTFLQSFLFIFTIVAIVHSQPSIDQEEMFDQMINIIPRLIDNIKARAPDVYKDNQEAFKEIESKIALYHTLTDVLGKKEVTDQILAQLLKIIPQEDLIELETFIIAITPYINIPSIDDIQPNPLPDDSKKDIDENEDNNLETPVTLIKSVDPKTITAIMIVIIIIEILLLIAVGFYIISKQRITRKDIEYLRPKHYPLYDETMINTSQQNMYYTTGQARDIIPIIS